MRFIDSDSSTNSSPISFGVSAAFGPFLRAATLILLTSMAPSAAVASETLLARALSCQIGEGDVANLMDRLAGEEPGMKTPVQYLAAPSGNLYRLVKPVSALGYSASEIYVSPGRFALVVSGQAPASVAARLKLTPVPYGPAERQVDGTHKIVAYELHQDALAGKTLVGCEYSDPIAQAWLAPDKSEF